MLFRRLLATLLLLLLFAPAQAQAQDQSAALQLLVRQLNLPANWQPDAGSAPPKWTVNQTLFGLSGVNLVSFTAAAAAADGKPTGAITANLSIGGTPISGTLASQAGSSGLEEVWIQLDGKGVLGLSSLTSGLAARYTALPKLANLQLQSARVGFRPGSQLGYLSGALVAADNDPWKGHVAVTASQGRVSLFVQPSEVNLQDLIKPTGPVPLPSNFPKSVLMFNSGTGAASPVLTSLPLPVQAMFSEVTQGLPLPEAFPMAQGLGIWSRVTAQDLKIPAASPLKLPPMVVGGEIQLGQSMALAGRLAGPGLSLAGWVLTQPSFYFGYSAVAGANLGVRATLATPVAGGGPTLNGALSVSLQTGALAMTGTLAQPWVNPLALQGATLKQGSGITLSIDTQASFGLGVQGGLEVAGATAFKNTLVCINATLAAGVPVVSAMGLRFEADALDPALALKLMNGFVQYAANSPATSAISKLVSGGQNITALKGKEIGAAITGVPLPQVNQARFYLVTPGLNCDLPANTGMGAELAGSLRFMNQTLAATDSGFNLDKGFWLGGNVPSFSVGNVFNLRSAKVDVAAPMPTSPQNIVNTYFKINGAANLAFFDGELVVNFSKDRVQFDADAALADFFKARLQAASLGADGRPTASLANTSDFKLSLAASADTAALKKEILRAMARALQPKATTRRDEAKAKRPSKLALDKAQEKAARLNNEVGGAYRALLVVVNNADSCLQGNNEACNRLVGGLGKAAERLASAVAELKAMAKDLEKWGEAESEWAALALAEQTGKASEDLWNGFLTQLDGLVRDVAGAAAIVAIDKVAFEGLLKQGKGQLAVDLTLDPRPINRDLAVKRLTQTFDVDLGKSVAPAAAKGGGYERLAEAVATGYAGLRPPDTVPKIATATALTWDSKDGQYMLTAKVDGVEVRQESGGSKPPGGTLTLYRVGKDGKLPGLKVASSTDLNQKGSCSAPSNSVRFPAPAGSGCNTPAATGSGAFALNLDPGANLFYVEYAGDGAYLASSSKFIVISASVSCGKLEKLAGATVRLVRPQAANATLFDYLSIDEVFNSSLNAGDANPPKTLYLFDKAKHSARWDLQFRLSPVAGRADHFTVETVRDCGASGKCPRLGVAKDGDVELRSVARTDMAEPWTWKIVSAGGRHTLSTASRCPKGVAVCYPGINSKAGVENRPVFGDPGSSPVLGRLVLQAEASSVTLEEVCLGK